MSWSLQLIGSLILISLLRTWNSFHDTRVGEKLKIAHRVAERVEIDANNSLLLAFRNIISVEVCNRLIVLFLSSKMSIVILLRDDAKEINKLKSLNERPSPTSKQDLPQPSFRKISNADYQKKKFTKRKNPNHQGDGYYRYEELSPEEQLNRVEYDMDDQDEAWLTQLNAKLRAEYNGCELSESDFERVMDRLEKESYFESKSSGKEIVQEVDEDAVCAICLNGDSDNNTNQIIFCDMCDLPVHQECYGVPYIPEGQWLCRRCLQSPSSGVDCILCPNKGGAFKQTDDNRWAHVICALWIPEVCFANTVFLEPIDNICQIPAARWKLTCYICKQKRNGACIQCCKTNCFQPFHVTCAQQAGLYMRIATHRYDGDNGPFIDVMKEAFCDAHAPKDKKKKRGMYSVSDDETETEEDQLESRNYCKKRSGKKKDSISKTRRILAEKRASDPNPTCEPKLRPDKIAEISNLINVKSKKTATLQKIREDIMSHVQGYWMMRRKSRKGVPLLRRLQVSFGGSVRATRVDLDEQKYTRLRYDLEKARLLVGEVKKRELIKKRLFKLTKEITEKRFEIIDREDIASED